MYGPAQGELRLRVSRPVGLHRRSDAGRNSP
jgi:hypothetical protein